MFKEIKYTLFFLTLFIPNLNAQSDSNHGDWKFLNGSSMFYLYTAEGSGIENFSEIQDFTIEI